MEKESAEKKLEDARKRAEERAPRIAALRERLAARGDGDKDEKPAEE